MAYFHFLEDYQVLGNDRVDVIKKYGIKIELTDFAITLGAQDCEYECNNLKIASNWATRTYNIEENTFSSITPVTHNGRENHNIFQNDYGIRPVAPYNQIRNSIIKRKIIDKIEEIQYGEYPQTNQEGSIKLELETEYKKDTLIKTGKHYTTNIISMENNKEFVPTKHIEYEYKGNKYIRVVSDYYIFSNDKIIETEDYKIVYWIKVEPITWLLIKEINSVISKKVLLWGIPYCKNKSETFFTDSFINKYLNTYFSKEIIPSILKNTVNSYNFKYDDIKEEDAIKGYIESDIPVFLHGKSGDGKSDRVRSIDKDLTILYLRNSSIESICGKSVYNEKEDKMIDVKPTWLIKLEEKCEKEPDKLHILFLDELTNALPSIQGIAFNIVLNKEVNGIWELPKNVRIVAAGNELEDSLSANELSEPLHGRFAHVYIKTDVNNWLKWAKDANIHPSIVAFIAYKKDSVLRSKYDGVKLNADPRKWEMSSKVLYKTSNPEMLRGLVGEDITRDFILFTKERIITKEDVLNNNYSADDLDMNTSEKYMTTVGLLDTNIDEYDIVHDFLEQLGNEFLTIFNSLWANDTSKLEKIAEYKINKGK